MAKQKIVSELVVGFSTEKLTDALQKATKIFEKYDFSESDAESLTKIFKSAIVSDAVPVPNLVWYFDARSSDDIDKTKIAENIIHAYSRRKFSKPEFIAVSEWDIGSDQFDKLVEAGIPVKKCHLKPLPKIEKDIND